MHLKATSIEYDNGTIRVLDQTLLPHVEEWVESKTIEDMYDIIKALKVRGAPLIGIAAAFALAQYAKQGASIEELRQAGARLIDARPTAVNLKYCVDRILEAITQANDSEIAVLVAKGIFEEDVALCQQIAEHGAALLPNNAIVMTYCNTGGLATAGVGTALGVIMEAHKQGKIREVYVCETRPLLQGGRLTTWELKRAGIPYKLIFDNMAAQVLRDNGVSAVIVGADRIVGNGDVANKIGTYSLACLAKMHRVPFYVAAPGPTLDENCRSGADIVIEHRSPLEVQGALGSQWAPEGDVHNPAFDVTPAKLITLYILDTGNVRPDALFAKRGNALASPLLGSPVVSPVVGSPVVGSPKEDILVGFISSSFEDPPPSQPRERSKPPILDAYGNAQQRRERPRSVGSPGGSQSASPRGESPIFGRKLSRG